ncbi:MAG: Ig-like domain-containing protein, partial [Verrucomicrobia bacterium]|nr:Ig-like domain-containing protein [Verrucomicrobiota bacterium]
YAEGGVDPQTLKTSLEALAGYKNTVKNTYEALSASNPVSKAIEVGQCVSSLARVGLDKLCANKDRACAGYWTRGLCNSLQPAIAAGDILLQNMEKMDQDIRKAPLLALCSSFDLLAVSIGASASAPSGFATRAGPSLPDPQILALMDEIIRNGDRFVELMGSAPVALESLSVVEAWMRPVVEDTLSLVLTDAGALDNTAFAVELDGTVDQRGRISAQGGLSLNVRPGIPYRILAYDPVHHALFLSQGMTPRAGRQAELAEFKLARLDEEPDADGDGLPDVVEAVVGSDPLRSDTDGDGVNDFAEVRQGLDPLGGRLAETGIIATAATPGNAVDIAAANRVMVTANETGGMSVFSLSGGRSPIQIAQVVIPGSALRVALEDSRVAVAAGSGGLVVVDLSDPPAAGVLHRIPIAGSVQAVAAMSGQACAGTASGELVLVELAGGGIESRLRLGGPVRDVAFGARWVYALTDRHLYTLDPADGTLSVMDSVASPTPTGGHQRLFVGDTHAFAVHPRGCNIFDLLQPASPRLIAAGVTPQFGWKQMVPNGSGLGVAAVGRNRSLDGPHEVSVYDLRDPARPDVFLREFPTPGIARAVTVYDGRAYVADGPAGIQVIQYLPFDTRGQAPTLQLTTSHAPGRAEAGQVLRVRAEVTDDVQVAEVTFLLNGDPVFTDGNFPFEFRFVVGAPRLLNLDPFQLQAIALDTGGNAARSPVLNLRIVPDAQAPRVRRVAPFDGALTGTVRAVSAFLSEPADPATVNSASFRVWSSGPDQEWGTPDDVAQDGAYTLHPDRNAIVFTPAVPLTTGDYRVRLAEPLADSAGNRLEAPWESAFRVFGFLDVDADGMPDELEPGLGLNPAQADSDGDGVLDGAEDFDRDGLPNAGEVFAETDPAVADSDGDGERDGLEDPDGDVLDHAGEYGAGTNPRVADTDRDGWNDEAEVTAGSDPLNPRSRPGGIGVTARSLTVLVPAVVGDLGLGTAAGLHVASPPVAVMLPSLAGDSGLPAGAHVARPPLAVVIPVLAQGAVPVAPGSVLGGPPLQVTIAPPVTAAA